MIITKQDVLAIAPELSAFADPGWALVLAYCNELNADGIGGFGGNEGVTVRFARILLAAHYATAMRRGRRGAVGPVTSEAAGDLRHSFGLVALASKDAALGSTTYGQQYLGLLQASPASGPWVP